jgi:hypothetical protein
VSPLRRWQEILDAFVPLIRDATSPTLYRETRKGLLPAGLFSFSGARIELN